MEWNERWLVKWKLCTDTFARYGSSLHTLVLSSYAKQANCLILFKEKTENLLDCCLEAIIILLCISHSTPIFIPIVQSNMILQSFDWTVSHWQNPLCPTITFTTLIHVWFATIGQLHQMQRVWNFVKAFYSFPSNLLDFLGVFSYRIEVNTNFALLSMYRNKYCICSTVCMTSAFKYWLKKIMETDTLSSGAMA